MLLMPPGSAKSTYASIIFPAWWLAQNPQSSVIATSHTAGLAAHFGRGVRAMFVEHEARLDVHLCRDGRTGGRIATQGGGEYFAIGVGGAVTGRRADLALIDDPIASFMDAESRSSRERLWNWYRAELVTRLKPNANTVLIMNRWHEDDLAGRLLQRNGWKVICLPALANEADPLGREIGAALWPEWEDRAALLAKQTTLGERCFAALFQQTPIAAKGRLFDLSKVRIVDRIPLGISVRAWDLAGTGDACADPDWTVGLRLLQDEHAGYIVEDVHRVRIPAGELNGLVRSIAEQDGTGVIVGLPRDPGQAGLYQIAIMTRMLAGFRVLSSPETGSKTVRASAVSSQVGVGNLHLSRAPWNDGFLEELAAFPHGKKDDQVDALSRAFQILSTAPTPTHYTALSFIGR